MKQSHSMIIIGITGTLGAGKGTIVKYLVEKYGFKHFSVRQYLADEIIRRGLPVNRDSMVAVANDLRASHDPGYIVRQLYAQAKETGTNAVLESVRTSGEVQVLRDAGRFYLFAVDADSKVRYKRIQARASETDRVSYERFLADEKREMTSEDPNKQNLAACIGLADFVFTNDGTITGLHGQVDRAMQGLVAARS